MSVSDIVKSRLQEWVEDAIGGFVTVEWWANINQAAAKPQTSIKLGKQANLIKTFNDEIPQSGVFMEVPFTIRISDILERQYPQVHPTNHHAMDAAEVVADYLYSKRRNETEQASYYIYDVYDIIISEYVDRTTVRNRKMGIMEITGKLLVKYID